MKAPAALQHAIELIRRQSITPEDGGCQDYMASVLEPLGFTRESFEMGGVDNTIFIRPGEREGVLAFAGHTDVVPTGLMEQWHHAPFEAVVEKGVLHGRGAQDMKGALACMLSAVEDCTSKGVPLPTLQLLITSDEEGESIDGTVRIVEFLEAEKQLPDTVIVGEPTSDRKIGDTIRRGRRGVVSVQLQVEGKQGHSAYPQDADNALHRAVPILQGMLDIDWGEPAEGFPPTTCQITNAKSGTGANNVIPGLFFASLDIRYNPGIDYDGIVGRLEAAVGTDTSVKLGIQHQANAFSTPDGPFLDLACDSIRAVTGLTAERSTGGGTSDGRFFAAAGIPVAEVGLTNGSIHQVNECVEVKELQMLTDIYHHMITHFGTEHAA